MTVLWKWGLSSNLTCLRPEDLGLSSILVVSALALLLQQWHPTIGFKLCALMPFLLHVKYSVVEIYKVAVSGFKQ